VGHMHPASRSSNRYIAGAVTRHLDVMRTRDRESTIRCTGVHRGLLPRPITTMEYAARYIIKTRPVFSCHPMTDRDLRCTADTQSPSPRCGSPRTFAYGSWQPPTIGIANRSFDELDHRLQDATAPPIDAFRQAPPARSKPSR